MADRNDIYIDKEALERVDRKLRADQTSGAGLESSWKNPSGQTENGPSGPISNPGPRIPWYKQNGKVRPATYTEAPPVLRVEQSRTVSSNIFALNMMVAGDVALWTKTAPKGWADIVFLTPPFWRDRGDAWKTSFGHEKTVYEYNGKLFSLVAEVSRMLRPTGEVWLLQENAFAFKLKEFDLKTIDVYRPSQGTHLFARYAKSKKKSIALPDIKAVAMEGFDSTLVDPCVTETILKQVGQEGANVLSLFAGDGSICHWAKKMSMFYIGIDAKPHEAWKGL